MWKLHKTPNSCNSYPKLRPSRRFGTLYPDNRMILNNIWNLIKEIIYVTLTADLSYNSHNEIITMK